MMMMMIVLSSEHPSETITQANITHDNFKNNKPLLNGWLIIQISTELNSTIHEF